MAYNFGNAQQVMSAPPSLMQEIPVDSIDQRIRRDELVVALIGMIAPPRLGVISFLTFFEHEHFMPGTPRSELFESYTVEWEGACFVVIVFPKTDLPLTSPILKKLGLAIGNGIPVMQDGSKTTPFPITAPNAYSLQYVPGHFAYTATGTQITQALEAERQTLKREFRKIKDRLNA